MKSVLDILEEALVTQNWDLVKQGMELLGYPLRYSSADQFNILPSHEIKFVTEGISKGGQNIEEMGNRPPPPRGSNEYDDFKVDRQPKGDKSARVVGVNLFNPTAFASLDEDEGYDRINDQVPPTPRTRPPAVAEVPVYCEDCNKTVNIHPQFKKVPFHCEYTKLGQKCPRSR